MLMMIRIAVISMLCTSSAALTCMDGVMFVSSMDSKCPRQCSNDDDGDDSSLPKCQPSQSERSSLTCGTDTCGTHIASIDDAKLESAMEALETCASDPNTKQYAVYADMGVDYIKMFIMGVAKDCGHKSALKPPSATTCGGAMSIMTGFDGDCPRQCSTEANDDGHPICEQGQKERSPSVCGTDRCSDFIASIDDARLESAMVGFKACASNPTTAGFAQYADMGVDYLKMAVTNMASECGLSDKVALSKASPSTCGGAMSMLAGFDRECPRQCKNAEDDDANLPKCEDKQKERSNKSCGTAQCTAFIASLYEETLKSMLVGFKDCESNPATAQFAQYGKQGVGQMQMHVNHIAGECGVPSPTDPPPTTTTTTNTDPPTTTESAAASPGDVSQALHDKPKWWFISLLTCATFASQIFAT